VFSQVACGRIVRIRPVRLSDTSSRLVTVTDDAVSFRWQGYRREGRRMVTTLESAEFMRRFLLHALP